jgi:NodT family efflux transporter outer membrane factor (OMF) lipoprotein
MTETRKSAVALIAATLAFSGCSLAPTYQVPAVDLSVPFKDLQPWTVAQPADLSARGPWWSIYGDSALSELEEKLDKNSPDITAAFARYAEAQAYDLQANAGLFPTLSGLLDGSRNRQSDYRPLRGSGQPNEYGTYTVGVEADYELDLWGRVHNTIVAARSETQAAKADLASAKLSLEVRLATDYVALLGRDRDIQLLVDTVGAYEKALVLTTTLHDGGIVSGLDVSRARAQLEAAKAQVAESRANRALLEHAIAALVGESAASFSLTPAPHVVALPQIPSGIPADLLQRRPDIAAAERRVAAANAGIGIARAAFFPSIDLTASIGLQSVSPSNWLTAPAAYWAIGPSLAQTIFDGGLRSAQLARVRAALDESAASYRSTVLSAVQQVQDDLSLLSNYQTEYDAQLSAVDAAQTTLNISLTQYRDGGVAYLEVVDSQTAALAAQRLQLDLETRRLQTSIDLVRSLGGGWSTAPS